MKLRAVIDVHGRNIEEFFGQHEDIPVVNHGVCYFCLMSQPDHFLPCGHVLCSQCALDCGSPSGQDFINLRRCPLHELGSGYFQSPLYIYVQPSKAGVRILALDGGGVRGIVQLAILEQLEEALAPLPVQAFFDLVLGTSTGGLTALGLGACHWSVKKSMFNFEKFCNEAFTGRKLNKVPVLRRFVETFHLSKYNANTLEESLYDAYGTARLFSEITTASEHGRTDLPTKVAVTASDTARNGFVLASYNRCDSESRHAPYHFCRSEDPRNELKIWEAARATSAAPTYFKPFAHVPSGKIFLDGGLFHNNPIEVALREARLLWPGFADLHPDIVCLHSARDSFQ